MASDCWVVGYLIEYGHGSLNRYPMTSDCWMVGYQNNYGSLNRKSNWLQIIEQTYTWSDIFYTVTLFILSVSRCPILMSKIKCVKIV